ncbi:DNA cytosine methyltransferase [Rugamonas apoptosis]|uniref:DNA (cytosine-5-)-methyltransferase n=1 Tax=Rugamonas apoptosis TaxID=2758570 RepID=A0A7W2IM11_9BURK|nr:DNA cytosine methyltransferase [Rugamonas apoptosis]MBA5689149.1 DNA cytosine methyltransferase [Rugamonas apoptosis]
MNSIELFAGAGGLAMGIANAGFDHRALVEWNPDACQTIRENHLRYSNGLPGCVLYEGDARTIDYASLAEEGVAIVSGGPPCQPFSLGGKHAGYDDTRDMFPEAVRSIREIHPQAFIFENVKGLLRESFASYLEYIILQLSYPDLARSEGEEWEKHLARLERHHTAGARPDEFAYNVVFRLLNAANYGVPQKRERVFIVGFRRDLGIEWAFPEPTHSEDALLRSKWITGEYWERHGLAMPVVPAKLAARLQRIATNGLGLDKLPWLTVRDAIGDLPDPQANPRNGARDHVFIPGARTYAGHTGSPIDEPSKTLKAGDHGVPGGENMIAMPDGAVRYFTVREAARMQTFPDDYVFHGSWGEIMRQLGNAVPVRLAQVVAAHVHAHLPAP